MSIKKLFQFLGFAGIFISGALFGAILQSIDFDNNIPTGYSVMEKADEVVDVLNPLNLDAAPERASPGDHINEYQIDVFADKVVLDIKNAQWAAFADTNSMDPVLDQDANAIQIVPKSEADIEIGDIISYDHPSYGRIIHRVAYKGQDEKGAYFIAKGDNNPTSDPDKIRFEQIRTITVAIIY